MRTLLPSPVRVPVGVLRVSGAGPGSGAVPGGGAAAGPAPSPSRAPSPSVPRSGPWRRGGRGCPTCCGSWSGQRECGGTGRGGPCRGSLPGPAAGRGRGWKAKSGGRSAPAESSRARSRRAQLQALAMGAYRRFLGRSRSSALVFPF